MLPFWAASMLREAAQQALQVMLALVGQCTYVMPAWRVGARLSDWADYDAVCTLRAAEKGAP